MKSIFILLFALALAPLVVAAEESGFQTLTGLPVFENVRAGGGLSDFFNQLYVLSVGAATVIAIAQIMIAGFKWATAGGNHSAIEQSRDLIRNSILGLVLVLSPTVVFGIINPDILNLRIDTGGLKRENAGGAAPQDNSDATPGVGNNVCSNGAVYDALQAELTSKRINQPTGEITMEIPGGVSGRGCCLEITDESTGRSCTSSLQIAPVQGGGTTETHICVCGR